MAGCYEDFKLIATAKVTGIRTSCHSSEAKEGEVELVLMRDSKSQFLIAVGKGGVTGFECFELDRNRDLAKMFSSGWNACMGRHGEWDALQISGKELAKAFGEFCSLLPTEMQKCYLAAKPKLEGK